VEVTVRLPRLLTGGAIVAVLAGTAACGLQSLEPKLELRNAASDFASAGTGHLRLSVASSAAQFRAFTAEADRESSASASTDISDADLKRLLSSSIDIAYDGGKPQDDADDAARIDVHVGRLDAAEIRVAHQVLYARVDLPGLEQQFPDMKDGADSARASLTGEDGSGDVVEALRAPATALFDGTWVSVDTGALQKQLRSAGADTGSGADGAGGGMTDLTGGLAADAPATLKKIAGKAFADGVTVKRLDGDARLGDHLVATASLRAVYKNIRGDLPALFSDSARAEISKSLPQPGDVPDRNLTVSFWVKDGTLTRVELDAAQFLDQPSGALVLRADSLPAEKITAPKGAVDVDVQAIADQAGMPLDQLFTGGDNAGGSLGAMDAQTIAGYVSDDINAMASQDGAAPSLTYLQQAIADMNGIADGLVIAPVGDRVQVTVGGTSACLVLPPSTDVEGSVTDGPCA
jgi:hypothetical protein